MARIQQVVSRFNNAGDVGPWLKHDFYETPFNLSFFVTFAGGLAGSFEIQYVIDDFVNDGERPVMMAQTGATITVRDSGPVLANWAGNGITHGLAVGDWIQLRGSPGGRVDGGYAVASVVDLVTYTVTSTVSQTFALTGGFVQSGRVMTASATDHIIPLPVATARTTIGVSWPIVASRLTAVAVTTAGVGILLSVQGGNLGNRV
jgi:hypothetical protein